MIQRIWQRVRAIFARLGWLWGSALVIGILLLFGVGISFLRGGTASSAPQNTTPSVTLDSVANLAQGGSALSVVGTVESQTQATVRAEKSGQITAVYHALGDSVAAGTIVGELENASERAAVLQAEGAVQAATAGANVSQTTLAGAKGSAVSGLLSAYGTVEKTLHTDIDPMFSNPESVQPQLTITTSNTQAKTNAENTRVSLTSVLRRQQSRATTLSSSDDLVSELTKTETEVRAVRDFLDTVIAALNGGIANYGVSESTLATYKATATAARSTITTILSSLISTHQTLETAQQNSTQGTAVISASQASLTQAQGTLAAARANLEHTIIRAPISGTINSLTLKRGDFVQASTPVMTVANNHALQVIAYITASDAPRIAVGDKAKIENSVEGTITKIAPALDPQTKKIEVKIGLPATTTTLLNGESVVVNFVKAAKTATKPISGPLTLPITTLKIGAEDIVVFSVDTNSLLVAHPVTLGTLMGDRVEIKDGVTPDMTIVTDARGLQSGEKVIVKE